MFQNIFYKTYHWKPQAFNLGHRTIAGNQAVLPQSREEAQLWNRNNLSSGSLKVA